MYKLRFVQEIKKEQQDRFLEIEKKFVALEENDPTMPRGRRYLPVMGKEPTNTFIWEAEYETLEEAMRMLEAIESNDTHTALLTEQVGCMARTWTELYKSFS